MNFGGWPWPVALAIVGLLGGPGPGATPWSWRSSRTAASLAELPSRQDQESREPEQPEQPEQEDEGQTGGSSSPETSGPAGDSRADEERAEASQVDWEDVWRQCATLLDGDTSRPLDESDPRVAPLWELATSADGDLVESPEQALLLTFLARRAGRSAELPRWPGEEREDQWPWSPRASWIAVEVLPLGARRERALLAALETLGAPQPGAPQLAGWRLTLAWDTWLAAAEALRFENALPIAQRVHADQAAPWSVFSFALTATRAGAYDEAERALLVQLGVPDLDRKTRGALENQLGTLALGRGRERQARSWYGLAMLSGSVDAVASVARLDLAAGQSEAARAGFRRALTQPEPGPWARRGWGLSLLPARAGTDSATPRLARGY